MDAFHLDAQAVRGVENTFGKLQELLWGVSIDAKCPECRQVRSHLLLCSNICVRQGRGLFIVDFVLKEACRSLCECQNRRRACFAGLWSSLSSGRLSAGAFQRRLRKGGRKGRLKLQHGDTGRCVYSIYLRAFQQFSNCAYSCKFRR